MIGSAFLRREFRCGVEDVLEGNRTSDREIRVACRSGLEREHGNLKLKAEPGSKMGELEGRKMILTGGSVGT